MSNYVSPGAAAITAERQRQIISEGWTSEHDDVHRSGSLAIAAECYIEAANTVMHAEPGYVPVVPPRWPWHRDWWKPADTPQRNLEKAGALLAAEWDRLDRLENA